MADTIRAPSMDAVEKANSGHPGMPMGMADIATVLWTKFLKFDPAQPHWPDRDRFILSNGHGSMLLYSLLHLTGYADMTMDQIKTFRQLGSRCAGHPERGHADGIEVTTGPLGQGIANSVGMALAERMLATHFGRDLVEHYTYVFCGDGCLMEGISQEAISFAGHLKLSKLILFWDDNHISIDGPTALARQEDELERFDASGWQTQRIDGHDTDAIADAIVKAQQSDKPSMIACRTIIGFGAPTKANTAAAHGAALGKDEIAGARVRLGWDSPPFVVPDDLAACKKLEPAARRIRPRGASAWANRRSAPTSTPPCWVPCRNRRPTRWPRSKRNSSPMRRRPRRAKPQAACSMRWRRRCPAWSAARPT